MRKLNHMSCMFLMIGLVMGIPIQQAHLSSMIHPVAAQRAQPDSLRTAAIKVGIGDPGGKVLDAVTLASKSTGLKREMILALMYTESSFRPTAISSKQYQGLMQIPPSKFALHTDEDINVLIGAKILAEKLEATKGNYKTALILYKGWDVNDPKGMREADKVITLYRKLREV